MFYVHATPAKGGLRAWLEAPLVFIATLWLHPGNGPRYAYHWSRQSVVNRRAQ